MALSKETRPWQQGRTRTTRCEPTAKRRAGDRSISLSRQCSFFLLPVIRGCFLSRFDRIQRDWDDDGCWVWALSGRIDWGGRKEGQDLAVLSSSKHNISTNSLPAMAHSRGFIAHAIGVDTHTRLTGANDGSLDPLTCFPGGLSHCCFFRLSGIFSSAVRLAFSVFQLRLRNTDSMLGLAEKEMQDAENNKRDLEVREPSTCRTRPFFFSFFG